MSFYDLTILERTTLVSKINKTILKELQIGVCIKTIQHFADDDTYIRKTAYLTVGRLYCKHVALQHEIIELLSSLFIQGDFKIRQTVINAAGEIGKKNFEIVQTFFDVGLLDTHHAPRNAVIGSIKKMGEVNPQPVLCWAKQYLHNPNKEIRREICHGIELRGRKYPQDILPLLKELQHDKTARVRNTLVHVLGQISYKKGCLETVVSHLKSWKNSELVKDAILEIIDVHHRYRSFATLTQEQTKRYIDENFY